MGAVTTVGAFLDGLRAALVVRAGLVGVNVYSGPVSIDDLGVESIILGAPGDISATYEYNIGTPRDRVDEEYTIPCGIWIVVHGGGETRIKAARDRALALIDEVHDQLASYTNRVDRSAAIGADRAFITSWDMEQMIGFEGSSARDCRIRFTITCNASFTPA